MKKMKLEELICNATKTGTFNREGKQVAAVPIDRPSLIEVTECRLLNEREEKLSEIDRYKPRKANAFVARHCFATFGSGRTTEYYAVQYYIKK